MLRTRLAASRPTSSGTRDRGAVAEYHSDAKLVMDEVPEGTGRPVGRLSHGRYHVRTLLRARLASLLV